MKWERCTLEVRVNDVLEMQKVRGAQMGPLAVHRSLALKSEEAWTVSHVRSGLAIATCFPSSKNARLFAERIRRLTDWSRTPTQLCRMGKEKLAMLKEIRDELRSEAK